MRYKLSKDLKIIILLSYANISNLPQPGPVYYPPILNRFFFMGRTIAADQYASQDSWKKLISFFQKTLKPTD